MGRELKRVALDFDWPLDKTWDGYLNPFYTQCVDCTECAGSGSSPEAKRLSDQWYGNAPFRPEDRGSKPWLPTDRAVRDFAKRNVTNAPGFYSSVEREAERLCVLFNRAWNHHLDSRDVAALIAAGRLVDFTQVWTKEHGWRPKEPPYIPTPQEVNEWSLRGFGHDSINCWVCVKAECERLCYPHTCGRCNGEGSVWPSPQIKKKAEDWKPMEPPSGDGYQLWETVSEGSPVSPVFKIPEELAEWLVANDTYNKMTRERWMKFILESGWAPSAIASDGHMMTGVEALTAP